MKNLTLGLCLALSSAALAHNYEYKVCEGDTLATISSKFHVNGKSILHANDLPPTHHLRPGHYLLIPGVKDHGRLSAKTHAKTKLVASKPHGFRKYKVRNGDFDWTLAQRTHITLHALHLMNPSVDWDALRIGSEINLPSSAPSHQVVAMASAHGHKAHAGVKTHAHVVAEGENDWIIAHRAGVRLPVLKTLNPGLDLASLKPGQKILVPGAQKTVVALHVPRIHSTHVAINGDNVTIRTEPGLGAESVCTVDQGLHASVVDRDGNWYQLKFPKGTVGWVRGDLLKPIHVIAVAEVEHHRRHHEIVVFHPRPHRQHSAPVVAYHHHHHQSASGEHETTIDTTAMDTDAGDATPVLRNARSMIGTRYRWGAASRSGTDCSGFTMQVLARNGIHVPRTSREQSGVGEYVARKDLRPGDLIFFHTSRGHRINHVAFYEGNNRFLHASSGSGHVRESSLNETFYNNRFSTARRVLHHSSKKAVSKPVETKKSEEKHEDAPKHEETASAPAPTTTAKAPDPEPSKSAD